MAIMNLEKAFTVFYKLADEFIKLEASGFDFHLTGPRFWGGFNNSSNYELFTQATDEVVKFLVENEYTPGGSYAWIPGNLITYSKAIKGQGEETHRITVYCIVEESYLDQINVQRIVTDLFSKNYVSKGAVVPDPRQQLEVWEAVLSGIKDSQRL